MRDGCGEFCVRFLSSWSAITEESPRHFRVNVVLIQCKRGVITEESQTICKVFGEELLIAKIKVIENQRLTENTYLRCICRR